MATSAWRERSPRAFAIVLVLVLVLGLGLGLAGCDSTADPADEGGGSGGVASVFGDARPSSNPEAARRVGTSAVNTAIASCGGGCSADVAAGLAHLSDGEMLAAFDAFQCADTPEAAFGAGIAKVLSVVESEAGDRVLADLGQPHLPATDLFGPNGLLARAAARWNGEAELTVSGGLQLQLQSEQVMADDWELDLRGYVDGHQVSLYVETNAGWTAGTVITPQYDCTSGVNRGTVPPISLYLDGSDENIDCEVAFALPAGECVPQAGSLRVVSVGSSPGDKVELELSDLPLTCRSYDNDTEAEQVFALSRISGHVSATVTLEVDTSGLHPIFRDQDDLLLNSVPAGATATAFMNDAARVAGEIASARCYFAKAAEGSGTVFTLPGAMYGGDDVALAAGDARMLAAAASFAAATLETGTSYELELPLRQAVCWFSGGLGEHRNCPSAPEFVSTFNTAAREAVVRHDRLGAAERLLSLSLEDFERGVDQLDEQSSLVRNPTSEPGWQLALELVHAAQDSLAGGATPIPNVTPALSVDLQRFFRSPPDPRGISTTLLSYTEECEDFGGGDIECSTDFRLERPYLEAFFGPYTDADWDGDYEWEARDVSDAVEEIGAQLRERGLRFGD